MACGSKGRSEGTNELLSQGTSKCTPVYISNVAWESNSFEPSDLPFDPQAKVKLALFV